MKTRVIIWGLMIPLLLAFLAGVCAAKAYACDPNNWYDPAHQVCQPYPPANSPGYQQPPTNYPDPRYPGWGGEQR